MNQEKGFAELFREARLDANITYRKIGEHCKKSIGYLCDIEHRRKPAPDLETVRLIEEALNVQDGRLVEAARRERSKPSVKSLQDRIAELEATVKGSSQTIEQLEGIIRTQEKGKAELIEVLKLYADENNWRKRFEDDWKFNVFYSINNGFYLAKKAIEKAEGK